MNKIMLIGNLTKDPELSETKGGVPYCNFSIAVSRNFKNADGERETDFFDCVCVWYVCGVCSMCDVFMCVVSMCSVNVICVCV